VPAATPGGGNAGVERIPQPSALASTTQPAVPEAAIGEESGPHSPAATGVRRPAHEQRSPEAACKYGDAEVSAATPYGASWRLPLAAADAPFSAREVQPLGRSAEGIMEATAALSLAADPPSGAC